MLEKIITASHLKSLAGATTFSRGKDYMTGGAVGPLRVTETSVAANVEGNYTYKAKLRVDDGDLAYDCTCPHAADDYFCKHCVAVGLAWLAEQTPQPKSGIATAKAKKKKNPWLAIKEYVTAQSPEILVGMLLDVAQRDDQLYQFLLFKAEIGGANGGSATAYRKAIDEATHVRHFVGWHEVGTFANKIDRVVDSLAELLKPDAAAMLVELSEHAIERVENSLEQVDDSNGSIGDTVCKLADLHLKACKMAKPEPTLLAERLFRLKTTLPFGIASFHAATYSAVLGKKGLERYRELAESAWRGLKPADKSKPYDSYRFSITRIMERLATDSGDTEALVAVKSQDLTFAYRYFEIAEIWNKAKQPAKALEWAERGLKAFPVRSDSRLRDFLVAAYLKMKRNDEALQLTWVQFEELPSLERYKKLHSVADKLRIWPAQRTRALAWVADTSAREANATSRWKPKSSVPDYSLRVAIALWEKDLDAAWLAVHEGACNRGLLITLAEKLETPRPADAVSLYQRIVPPIVEQTGNSAYEEAAGFVRKIGKLMNGQHQSGQFAEYVAALRIQFKPKRNFIKLLDNITGKTVRKESST